MEKVFHQLAQKPFFIPDWKIEHLFLGTFNPEGGEYVPYYYARSRNQTWPTLSKIFNVDLNPNNPNFFGLLKSNGIACMDMILSVDFTVEYREYVLGRGYSDSKIINNTVKRQYSTNQILMVINKNPRCKVYSTWGNGSSLKEWRTEIAKVPNIIPLVSPSLVAKVSPGVDKVKNIFEDWKSKIMTK